MIGSERLPGPRFDSTLPGQHLHSQEVGLKLNIMFCFTPKSNLVKQRTCLLSPSQYRDPQSPALSSSPPIRFGATLSEILNLQIAV